MRALQLTLDMSQRWLFGKPKYRPSRETIRPNTQRNFETPSASGEGCRTADCHWSNPVRRGTAIDVFRGLHDEPDSTTWTAPVDRMRHAGDRVRTARVLG